MRAGGRICCQRASHQIGYAFLLEAFERILTGSKITRSESAGVETGRGTAVRNPLRMRSRIRARLGILNVFRLPFFSLRHGLFSRARGTIARAVAQARDSGSTRASGLGQFPPAPRHKHSQPFAHRPASQRINPRTNHGCPPDAEDQALLDFVTPASVALRRFSSRW